MPFVGWPFCSSCRRALICTLDGSRSAARWYASNASAVWLLQDSYWYWLATGASYCCACRKQTHQSSEVVPNLRDIGVQADSARVSIERIPVLVDLVVKNTNGAPERRVPAITVDGLLVSLVRLRVLLLRHVTATQQVPTLRITLICKSVLIDGVNMVLSNGCELTRCN